MSDALPVIKFLFKQEWKVLADCVGQSDAFKMDGISTAAELVTFVNTEPASLVITSLFDKNDLVQLATFMKQIKGTKDRAIKVVVINFSGQKQFDNAIAKLGIQDVIEPKINNKALKFKIDFWAKALNAHAKKHSGSEMSTKNSKPNDAKTDDKKNQDQTASWQAPLECEDDIWIIKNETADCKKVLSKWLVRLMGPGPYVAQWNELEGKKNVWRFDIKEEMRDTYIPEGGSWYFSGDQKPEFLWKENLWMFTGTNFELFYRDKKNAHFSRLKLKEKSLTIAKNSDFGTTKEQIILESFDKELVFKGDAAKKEETDVVENDNVINTNLEGKGKTDSIENKDLSGKNSDQEKLGGHLKGNVEEKDKPIDDKGMGLKGETEKADGFWDGKSSTDEIKKGQEGAASASHRDGAELSQKNNKQEHQTKYKGHNEAEQFNADGTKNNQYAPGPEKHNDGAQLGLENKNQSHETKYKGHNEAEQFEANDKKNNQYQKGEYKEPAQNDFKGPASEKHRDGAQLGLENKNQSHETKYKGHNEAEQFEANDKKSNQYSKENSEPRAADEMSGKTNTDKIATHYGTGQGHEDADNEGNEEESQDPAERAKARAERAKREAREREGKDPSRDSEGEESGEELSGKGQTDKIATHYGSGKGSKDEKEKGSGFDAAGRTREPQKNNKDKESRPEDLYAGNPKARRARESNEENGDMSGQSSTDKLSSHYGSGQGSREDENSKKSRKDATEDLSSFNSKEESEDGSDENLSNVVSLEEARKSKELENILSKEMDAALEEACETAVVTSFLVQDGKKVKCKMDDFFEQTVIFSTDDPSIKQSSEVKLDLKFDYLDKETTLNVSGIVTGVDDDGEGNRYITVEVSAEALPEVEDFMKQYQKRQENIHLFIKTAKGY